MYIFKRNICSSYERHNLHVSRRKSGCGLLVKMIVLTLITEGLVEREKMKGSKEYCRSKRNYLAMNIQFMRNLNDRKHRF